MTSLIDISHFHGDAAPLATKVICFSPPHSQHLIKVKQLPGLPIEDDIRVQLDVIGTHIWSLHVMVPAMEPLV